MPNALRPVFDSLKGFFMSGYRPNLGFIGEKEVAASNYLFRQTSPTEFSLYPHAESLLAGFVKRSPEEHYIRSELLTEFIRKRGLTFSKKSDRGEVRTFSVQIGRASCRERVCSTV